MIATQVMPNSPIWQIDTRQMIGEKNWDAFLEKRKALKDQSIKLCELMLWFLDEEDGNKKD